jgi:lysozyme
MKTSEAGKQDIKDYEGVRYKAYLDTGGVWTIGVGHTGPDVYEGLTADENQVNQWLTDDLLEAEEGVERWVTVPLTQGQFDALVSFVFNLGEGQFRKSTLLRKLNAGDYDGARDQLHRWIYDNGRKLPGLVKRRIGESRRWES